MCHYFKKQMMTQLILCKSCIIGWEAVWHRVLYFSASCYDARRGANFSSGGSVVLVVLFLGMTLVMFSSASI